MITLLKTPEIKERREVYYPLEDEKLFDEFIKLFKLEDKQTVFYQKFLDTIRRELLRAGCSFRARKEFSDIAYKITLTQKIQKGHFLLHCSMPQKVYEEDMSKSKSFIIPDLGFEAKIHQITKNPLYLLEHEIIFNRYKTETDFAYITLDRIEYPSGKVSFSIKISIKPHQEFIAQDFFAQHIEPKINFMDLPSKYPGIITPYEYLMHDIGYMV